MKEAFKLRITEAFKAFKAEDARLASLPETELTGHPFSTCTNVAKWVKENYFPEANIMGYFCEDNPKAALGKNEGGHDFLVVGDYIIDFWPFAMGIGVPIFMDMEAHSTFLTSCYGDPLSWKMLK